MTGWLWKLTAAALVALGFVRDRNQHRIEAVKRRLKLRAKWMVLGVVAFGVTAAVGGAFVMVSGIAPIKASSGHWAITAWFLETSMERSVATHSLTITAPSVDNERLVLMGAGHYESGCRFCHGVPGGIMPTVTRHMTPPPTNLLEEVPKYDDAELFYIVRHGVKFTGMPAWPSLKREDEVWALVAFLRRFQTLNPDSYRELVDGEHKEGTEGVPEVVLDRCARCHGVDGQGRGRGAFPKLAGQRPDYLRGSLKAYQLQNRHSGIMETIATPLSAEQIEEAVRWYSQLPPPPEVSFEKGGRGAEIAAKGIPEREIPPCAECHGPGENPSYPAYPKLHGQYVDYLEQQLWLFQKGKRGGTEYSHIMGTVAAHKIDGTDIRDVAEFYGGK